MKISQTDWNYPDHKQVLAGDVFVELDQPGFGVLIAWNSSNLFKPFIVISVWQWRIQFGWVFDE